MAKYKTDGFWGEIETNPISEIIEVVKSHGTGGWIWDNGKINDDALVCDIFPILEDLKEYEIELDDETLGEIYENGEGENTYNWGANISNDLDWRDLKGVGCIVMVHLAGDVRGNYTNFFAIESAECIFECESIYQTKDINDRYVADLNALSDTYSVYDTETGEDVGEFYESDRNELIKELEEKLGEKLTESSVQKYNKNDAIAAYIDAYGGSKSNAIKHIKAMDEQSILALIDGLKSNAKKNFYSESLKESVYNVSAESIAKAIEAAAVEMASNLDEGGTYFYKLGVDNLGRTWAIVLGWQDGYDESNDDKYSDGGTWHLAIKLAYNDSYMKTDFDRDWEMPYDEDTGEVDDTTLTYYGYDIKDIEWLLKAFEPYRESDLFESKINKSTKKSLKESANNNNVIWCSSATRDWVYDAPIEQLRQEIIDEGNVDEEEIAEMDDDAIRDYFLDDEYYYWEADYEDLLNNIIPEIEKQCVDGRLWLVGNYQRWDGGHEAMGYYDNVSKGIEEICYPNYDATTYLCKDNEGVYFTETSHDAPMGGTAMYLFSLTDLDSGLKLADELYPEDGWEHDLYEVEEDFKWIKACIDKGIMKHIKW